MKILVDIDGVVADMIGKMLPILNKKHNTNFKHEDIKTWDFFSKSSNSNLLSEEQKQTMRDMLDEPGFAKEIPLIEGCVEALEGLSRSGCNIVWLTAQWETSQTWCYDRTQWIKKHLGHISKKIIYTWDKEEVGADLIIDDNPEFLMRWIDKNFKPNHGTSPQALLFKQPWNVDHGTKFELPFLNGWQDKVLSHAIIAHKIFR